MENTKQKGNTKQTKELLNWDGGNSFQGISRENLTSMTMEIVTKYLVVEPIRTIINGII